MPGELHVLERFTASHLFLVGLEEFERPTRENGTPALDVRVHSLRLVEQPASRPGTAILPWASCVILFLTTTVFGYRAYRVGALAPAPTPDNPPESR